MKKALRHAALGLAALVVLATFVPQFIRSDWWAIRALDFPRVQIFALCAFALAALAPFLRRRPAASAANALFVLVLAAAVLQGARILPYTPLWVNQVTSARPGEGGPSLRLLAANVLMSNREYARVLAQIEASGADLVILTEPDAAWMQALAPLEAAYPYVVRVPQDNFYGMLLYSRLPLIEPRVRRLFRPDIPSIHTAVELDGRRVELRFVHPRPPAPGEAETTTNRDAEILTVGREVRRLGGPAVVAGDLNDVAWSRTTRLFQRVSATLDPRRGRGLYATFHADYPLLRWPLDHVFHTEHFELVELRRLGHNGSDHFPLLVGLRMTPDATREQAPLDREPGDAGEAQEQIEDAREGDG